VVDLKSCSCGVGVWVLCFFGMFLTCSHINVFVTFKD
jgi:hypothetical protein